MTGFPLRVYCVLCLAQRAVRSLLSVATATAQRRSSARQAAMGEAAERARYADHLMSLNKPELLQHARHACVEVRNPTRVTKPALRALLLASKEQAEEHAAKVRTPVCSLRVCPLAPADAPLPSATAPHSAPSTTARAPAARSSRSRTAEAAVTDVWGLGAAAEARRHA
jgi:hypothetical protein